MQVAELQRLTLAMQGAERLSLTFRFEDGARTLDAASRDNLLDLVRLVDDGQLRRAGAGLRRILGRFGRVRRRIWTFPATARRCCGWTWPTDCLTCRPDR